MSTEKSKNIKIDKAVALSYKSSENTAPKVVAKGQGTVAEKIIELAKENGIPIKKDKDLVEVLSQIELNQEIPPDLYTTIAEILAWVYKANETMKGKL